jgi:hypothetical protein
VFSTMVVILWGGGAGGGRASLLAFMSEDCLGGKEFSWPCNIQFPTQNFST